jgi:hypothetical protein
LSVHVSRVVGYWSAIQEQDPAAFAAKLHNRFGSDRSVVLDFTRFVANQKSPFITELNDLFKAILVD